VGIFSRWVSTLDSATIMLMAPLARDQER